MSAVKLRTQIKRAVDRLGPEQLASVADDVSFLARPTVAQRLANAEKAVASGKATNWRKVRSDV